MYNYINETNMASYFVIKTIGNLTFSGKFRILNQCGWLGSEPAARS